MLKLGKQLFRRNDLRDIAVLSELDLWLLHMAQRHDMLDFRMSELPCQRCERTAKTEFRVKCGPKLLWVLSCKHEEQ